MLRRNINSRNVSCVLDLCCSMVSKVMPVRYSHNSYQTKSLGEALIAACAGTMMSGACYISIYVYIYIYIYIFIYLFICIWTPPHRGMVSLLTIFGHVDITWLRVCQVPSLLPLKSGEDLMCPLGIRPKQIHVSNPLPHLYPLCGLTRLPK